MEAVLKFSVILNTHVDASTPAQAFTCRASTFLALPVFQFAFHYSDGSVKELPWNLTLTEGALNTSYGWLSNIRKDTSAAERSLKLRQSLDVTHVSCMVYMMKSNQWINETLEVLVVPFVENDNCTLKSTNFIVAPVIFILLRVLKFNFKLDIKLLVIAAISALCVLLVIFQVCTFRLQMKLRGLTSKEVQEFLEGDGSFRMDTILSSNEENVTDESIRCRMGFPQQYRLSADSYKIGRTVFIVDNSELDKLIGIINFSQLRRLELGAGPWRIRCLLQRFPDT